MGFFLLIFFANVSPENSLGCKCAVLCSPDFHLFFQFVWWTCKQQYITKILVEPFIFAKIGNKLPSVYEI
jgi:hypothetical protein